MRNRKEKTTKPARDKPTGYDAEEDEDEKTYAKRVEIKDYVPFYEIFDLDKKHAFLLLCMFRLFCTLTMTKMLVHPDELYQGTQIAYDFIFGGVDLPWEWRDPYRIRNALYPIYLSWPLALMKHFQCDYQYLVLLSPYIAHFPLMALSDWYLWKIGKHTVGKDATRVAFILMLTNMFMVEYEIRCFTNTLEKILNVIAFWFFL